MIIIIIVIKAEQDNENTKTVQETVRERERKLFILKKEGARDFWVVLFSGNGKRLLKVWCISLFYYVDYEDWYGFFR